MKNKLFSIMLLVSMLASLVGAAVPATPVSAESEKFTLTVSVNPLGWGTVDLNPPQPFGGYITGTTVTLTPLPASGYYFTCWSYDGITATNNPFAIQIMKDWTITANFSQWQPMNTNSSLDLRDIWGTGTDNIYVITDSSTIMHWTGSSWHEETAPDESVFAGLYSIWGSSANDIWVGGADNDAYHFNGSVWIKNNPGSTGTSGNNITDIWGLGPNEVYFVNTVNSGTIRLWNGSVWDDFDNGVGTEGIWGSSSNDIYFVGASVYGYYIWHYKGIPEDLWDGFNNPLNSVLYDVWSSSATDIFAVANSGGIIHSDGSAFTQMTSNTTASLNAIWGSASDDVYAVGSGGTIMHYDGSAWTQMVTGLAETFYGIWGTSDGSDVYAVGTNGTVLHLYNAPPTYTLTMAVSPEGAGTTNPSVGDHEYTSGSLVAIEATAAEGYTFTNWTGDGIDVPNDASTSVNVDSTKTVTANFEADISTPTYTLTMAVYPDGAGTTSPEIGDHDYTSGSSVAIEATAAEGYTFTNWTGDGIDVPNDASTSVNVDSTKTVTANFEADAASYPSDKIVFVSDMDEAGNEDIYIMDPDGTDLTRLTDSAGDDSRPVLSPDGNKVVFCSDRNGEWQIFTMEVAHPCDTDYVTALTALTAGADYNYNPTWSPTGAKIAFESIQGSDTCVQIYIMDANGLNETLLTTNSADFVSQWPTFSPDGDTVLYTSDRGTEAEPDTSQIYKIHSDDTDGSSEEQVTTSNSDKSFPAVSPDASKIAYSSNGDIYILTFGETATESLIYDGSLAESPAWSLDGDFIAYANHDGTDFDIYIMEADGSNPDQIIDNTGIQDYDPNWGTPTYTGLTFTTTTITSNHNPSIYGQSVTFTATVSITGAGTPTGTVAFMDGVDSLDNVGLSGSGPYTVTFSTSTLSEGSHSITAVYSGDNSFNGSTSAALTQTVNALGAATGKIAFSSTRDINSQIYIMNADGSYQTNLSDNAYEEKMPDLSYDGDWIVYVRETIDGNQIYIMNADGSDPLPLLNNDAAAVYGTDPTWSPDGSMIAYVYDNKIWRIEVDGSGIAEQATNADNAFPLSNPDWVTGHINFQLYDSTFHRYDVCEMLATATGFDPYPNVGDSNNYKHLVSSVDGARALASDRSGNYEIWTGTTLYDLTQLTDEVGPPCGAPSWSPNGHFLAFTTGDNINSKIKTIDALGNTTNSLSAPDNNDFDPSWGPGMVRPAGIPVNWGLNTSHQLGVEDYSANNNVPLYPEGLTGTTVQIDGGEYHTLALQSDGAVYAWGNNGNGQCGQGGINSDEYPDYPDRCDTAVKVKNPAGTGYLSDIIDIAANSYFSLALSSDGTVYAWGYDSHGELGNDVAQSADQTLPVAITSLSGIVDIAAGSFHGMALKSDGTVWTWGNNTHGQLGDGTIVTRFVPVQAGSLDNIASIAAGVFHSLALTEDGTAYAWGWNPFGQLGDGTNGSDRNVPVLVDTTQKFVMLSGGGCHSLGLKADGTVYGWGDNSMGQFGSGNTSGSNVPVKLNNFSDITMISAGAFHTMVLTDQGLVYTTGANNDSATPSGQLGNGTWDDSLSPVQVLGVDGAGFLTDVIFIEAGYSYSTAITTSVQIPPSERTIEFDTTVDTTGFGPWMFDQDLTPYVHNTNPDAGVYAYTNILWNTDPLGNGTAGSGGSGTPSSGVCTAENTNLLANTTGVTMEFNGYTLGAIQKTEWENLGHSGDIREYTGGTGTIMVGVDTKLTIINSRITLNVSWPGPVGANGGITGSGWGTIDTLNSDPDWVAEFDNGSGQVEFLFSSCSNVVQGVYGVFSSHVTVKGASQVELIESKHITAAGTYDFSGEDISLDVTSFTRGGAPGDLNQDLFTVKQIIAEPAGTAPAGVFELVPDCYWEMGTVLDAINTGVIFDFHDILNIATPSGLRILKRADATQPWTVYADQELVDSTHIRANNVTSFSQFALGSATGFEVTGYPSPQTVGVEGDVTVFARDAYGAIISDYDGTVHFTSSDSEATLPTDTTLTSGTGTFNVTFATVGTQSITATDTADAMITGSQEDIEITSAPTVLTVETLVTDPDDVSAHVAPVSGSLICLGDAASVMAWIIYTDHAPSSVYDYDHSSSEAFTDTLGEFNYILYDLEPDTTYHFRAFVREVGNDSNQAYGDDMTFTTKSVAGTTVVNKGDWGILSNQATVRASLYDPPASDQYASKQAVFEYWPTADDTDVHSVNADLPNPLDTINPFDAALTGLTPGTSYSYQAKVTFDSATYYSDVRTLTTVAGELIDTSITLSSDPNPSIVGQTVTFTAVVTPDGGPAEEGDGITSQEGDGSTPTGTVTFWDGATELDTIALDESGQAVLEVSDLAVGTHSIIAEYNGNASYFDSTSLPLDQIVYVIIITTTSLPPGRIGIDYYQTLAASGGTLPYTWATTAGTLPDGLSLSTDGVISGTPAAPGARSFTVQVTDEEDNTATKDLSITIDYGYTYIDSLTTGGPTYNWIEISGTGTEVLPGSDDLVSDSISLGPDFFFNFYGHDYSSLAIANNGLLFAVGTTWQFVNEPITNSPSVHGFIAPFWDDIVTWGTNPGSIHYQTLGTAPNRIFVVEWSNNQHYSTSDNGVTFEAILYEGSNNILFQYQDVTFGDVYGSTSSDLPPYDNGGSATVGIEGPTGDIGVQYSHNQQVLSAGLAILFQFRAFAGTNMHLSMNAPAVVEHGNSLTYTLYYNNFGDVAAPEVELVDTLPAGVSYVSSSDSGVYDDTARTVTWNIGTVAAFPDGHGYRTVTVNIPVGVEVGTEITNQAVISTTVLETRMDDNTSSVFTTVTGSAVPPDSSTGFVFDILSETRISGATVTLQSPDGTGGWVNVPDVSQETTDGNGQYTLDISTPGVYRVHVAAANHYPANSIVFTVPPTISGLNVGLVPFPFITTTSLPDGNVDTAYDQTLVVEGGIPSYVWALEQGSSLPDGLDLSAAGVISGTPTTEGVTNFTVKVTDGGANTDTQALSIVINPALVKPDLTVPSILVDWVDADTYHVQFTIVNNSLASAPASHAKYRVDGTLQDEEIDIPALGPTGGSNTTTADTADFTITDGYDTVIVYADSGSQITEENEDNNINSITVTPHLGWSPDPDLVVNEIHAEWINTPPVDGLYKVHFSVTNVSPVPAGASHAKFSIDGTDQGELFPVDALLPGGTFSGFFTTQITLLTGSDSIVVTADASSEVDEQFENNNTQTFTWNSMSGQPLLPNLAVVEKHETWSSPYAPTSTYLVSFNIANESTIAAGPFKIGLTVNGSLLPDKISVSGLAAGANYAATFNTPLSVSGEYDTIIVTADVDGDVPELFENDNSMTNIWNAKAVPTGSISGRIYADEGAGLEGSQVDVFGDDVETGADINDLVATTESDENGDYAFTGLPAGLYGIRVTAAGYVTEWYNDRYSASEAIMVEVTAGGETEINISLAPVDQVVTNDASSIGNTGATLNGALVNWVDTTGVTVYFEYWEQAHPGTIATVNTTFSGTGNNIPFSAVVGGLTEDTSYIYHAVAEVDAAKTYGDTKTFKTTHPWTTIINDSEDDGNAPYISTVQTYRGPGKVAFKVTGDYFVQIVLGANLTVYLDTDQNSGTGFPVNDIGADYALLVEGTTQRYLGQWNGSTWVETGTPDFPNFPLPPFVIEIQLSDLGNDDGNMDVVAEISNPDRETIDIAPDIGHGTTTQYTLIVALPSHGTVDIVPAQALYYEGTPVQLTPNADPGWQFAHWSGDSITEDNQTNNPLTLIMDGNKAISVTFIPTSFVDLVLSPATQTVLNGAAFDVEIVAQAGLQEVVGVDAYLDFDPDYLQVQSVTPGTALPDEIDNSFNNTDGYIDFSAGVLGDSYPTGTFIIATIRFQAVAGTSSTAVTFSDSGDRTTTVTGVIAPDITGDLYNGSYYINIPPTVTIEQAVGQADPTNDSPINFTVVFSEPVTGFGADDIHLGGTALPTTVNLTGSGPSYNVAVSGMIQDGTVTATVNAGAAQDADSAASAASTSIDNSVTYDTTAPTVTINTVTTPTNTGTQTITGTRETGATIVLTSATATFGAVSYPTSTTWSVLATLAEGSNVITATGEDAAGNTADANTTIVLDTTPPSVSINAVTTPTNLSTQTISGTKSTDSTVVLTSTTGTTFGTVTQTFSGTTWSALATLVTGNNAITATAADIVNNTAFATAAIFRDNTNPTVVIYYKPDMDPEKDTILYAGETAYYRVAPSLWSITFADTYGINKGEYSIDGGSFIDIFEGAVLPGTSSEMNDFVIPGFAGMTEATHTVTFRATDDAGNTGTLVFTFVKDITAPTLSIGAPSASLTRTGPITYTITYTGANSITLADGNVTLNATGTAAGTKAVTGTGTAARTVTISGITGNGTLGISIAAGTASDNAGNTAIAAGPSTTFTVDNIAPTVTLNQAAAQADPANTSPINFTVVFIEPVSDFATGDVTVSSGTAVVTGSGTTYNVAVSGMSQGALTAGIAGGVAHDAAGNANTASTSNDNSVTYDSVSPTVTINQAAAQADPTTALPVNFTVVFSEPVSDFATGDVTLRGTAGATTAAVTGTGTTYNVAVSGMIGNGTVIATVAAGKATDAAGNANTASTFTDNEVTFNLAAAGAQTWYINGDYNSDSYTRLTTNPASTFTNQYTYAWGMQYYLSSPTAVTFPAGNWTVHFTIGTPITRNINVGILRQDAATGWSQRVMASQAVAINNLTSNGTTAVDLTFALPEFTLTPSGATPGYLGIYWGDSSSRSMNIYYGLTYSYLVTPPGSPLIACPPYLTGMSATNVTSNTVDLTTTVAYMGSYGPADVHVDFVGQVYAPGSPDPVTAAGTAVNGTATGLSPSTYYYSYPRLTYGNNYRSYGRAVDFTTAAAPTVTLTGLAITPLAPANPKAGQTQQFTATGTYSNASTADLTNQVTWTSDNTDVAIINATGLARSLTAGTAHINASITIGGTTTNAAAPATLTVDAAVLDRIVISPDNPTVTFIAGAPPTVQFTATGVWTDGNTTNETANVTWNSSLLGKATIAAGGLATTVAAGTTNITASLPGPINSNTSVLTILADTIAPVVVLDYPISGLTVNAAAMTISGHLDDGNATVTIILNGTETALGSALVGPGADGYTFTKDITLVAGNNSIRAKAVDGAGNTGMSATSEVKYIPERTMVITITSPRDRLATNDTTKEIRGTVGVTPPSGTAQVKVRLNGVDQPAVTVADDGSAVSFGTVDLVEGDNIITVLGTTGTPLPSSGTITVTLDTHAPVITIDAPTDGAIFNTPDITVTGSVDDPDVDFVTLTQYIDVGAGESSLPPVDVTVASGLFSYSLALDPLPGTNRIQITAEDTAGNTSDPEIVTVTLDNTVPRVTLTNPSKTRTLTNAVTLQVQGNIDDLSITAAELYLNGTLYDFDTDPAVTDNDLDIAPDGSFSVLVDLTQASNTIEVRATDGINNGTSGVYTVTVDTTAPTLTIGVSEPTDSVIITVLSNEALIAPPVVTVDDSVNPVTTVTMTRSGINTWVGFFSDGGTVPAGDYVVTIVGTDTAGNTSTRTATFSKEAITVPDGDSYIVEDSTTQLDIENNTGGTLNAELSVTQHINNPSGLVEHPTGAPNAGVFVDISAPSEFRNALEDGTLSLTVTVSYNPADLPAGTDESTLKLYSWSTDLGIWEEVAGCVVNTTLHTITGTLLHLSTYGMFGSETVVTPPAPGGPGGGGGGGGGGDKTMLTSGLTANTPLLMTGDGVTINTATLTTTDKKASLAFSPGTVILNARGNPLSVLTAGVRSSPPAAPDGNALVLAYNFGPDGSTLNPGVVISMSYNPDDLPADVHESNLYLAYLNGTTYEALTSTVDTTAHTVSATITHFSTYALIGKLGPAAVVEPTPAPTPTPKPTFIITPSPTPAPSTTPAVAEPTVKPTPPATTGVPAASPNVKPTATKTTAAPAKTTAPPAKSSNTVIFVILGAIVVMGVVMAVLFIRRRGSKP